ncbi:YbbR-like domain-containing protein [Mesonia maritima]|uniref:YbbR-like protein n=1 Tax=Mesonia maritima TaxID=1793873 RepID=A0ABU1K3W8_9FLAO|nr:YbbR-like domain-containing protein [Mesonia maritima]MDR6300315.1 hypothetical protein [Mesonia maritima]
MFFLVFAVFIWIVVQFSKTYEKTVSVPLVFQNLPKDKLLEKEKANLRLRIQENGFGLAWFQLFKPAVKVDLEKLPQANKKLLYIVRKQQDSIAKEIELNVERIKFLQDTIVIPFQQKAVKTVKINPSIDISFAPGYSSEEQLKLIPDSIKISGPEKVLDTIQQLFTEDLVLKNVSDTLNGSIAIDTTKFKNLSFYKTKVDYKLAVEKFTEGKIEVPIELINSPENREVSIFPKKAVVVFTVSLQKFEAISQNDFRVVCDFSELQNEQNFLIPKLVKKPEFISASRLNINKVQFVIKK